ncbi:hypothetical protein ACIBO5_44520 [Nonomuraea angiospora]|uniref:hypothetical protein n=1 Tax=Nonomuraea angiospora TaxID=46172 RepID=UPI0029A054A4|nr:hypothetical protein [Nonomuraea angiospora]MDX3107314.1 hypothetical protein [Nonomuraea angiospora]
MRTSYRLLPPAVLSIGLLLCPVAPASAATTTAGPARATATVMALTLDEGSCEPLARRFLCSVSYSGAIAPVAIRWFVDGGHVPAYDNRSFVGIGCQPTVRYDIRAVISDATGASVEYRTTPVCRSGNP